MLLGLVLFLHITGMTQSPSRPKPVTATELEKLAQESVAEKDWETAADEFRRAAELDPHNVRLRAELGDALNASQDYPDAIAAFNEALRLDPRSEPAELGLAESYRLVFNYDESRKILERATQDHPASAAPHIALGRLEIELQHYDRAIEELQAAIKSAPRDMSRAQRSRRGLPGEGRFAARARCNSTPSSPRDSANAFAHFLRAQIYADKDDTAHALPDAEAVVAAQPDNTRGRILLGKILLRVPNCARAVEILQPLENAQPRESDALFLLARAYQCAGDAASAQRVTAEFEQSSKADRAANENTTQAGHLVHEANELALKNQFAQAMDLLNQALEKDPANSDAHAQLAKLLYSKGDLAKASRINPEVTRRPAQQPRLSLRLGENSRERKSARRSAADFRKNHAGESEGIRRLFRNRRDPPAARRSQEAAAGLQKSRRTFARRRRLPQSARIRLRQRLRRLAMIRSRRRASRRRRLRRHQRHE